MVVAIKGDEFGIVDFGGDVAVNLLVDALIAATDIGMSDFNFQ